MSDASKKNRKMMLILLGLTAGMIGLSFAAVPLYQIFCQVTGYGGTTQAANAAPEVKVLERTVKVRFNAEVDKGMPWDFEPSQKVQEIHIGEKTLATYDAYNPTGKRITGTAVFNVTPYKVGEYFDKIQCFCFTEQTLEPGEHAKMPVTYYVDPAIADDPYMDDVTEITLSYTFYLSDSEDVPEMDHGDMDMKHHDNQDTNSGS